MASPTAIPNPSASSHHQPGTPPPPSSSSANAFSRSPTGTNPNPLVSPIYTSAGRSAFSLPGPNSNSTSPTTSSWYSAGFASNNSQRVRSLTSTFSGALPPQQQSSSSSSSNNSVTPQRDYFVEGNSSPMSAHYRKASFGSASQSSSISSNDLINEPPTPKATEASLPVNRVTPLGTSFEHIKGHRASWQAHAGANWNGLQSMRGVPPTSDTLSSNGGATTASGMGGIFRKFSFGSASQPAVKMAPQSSTSINGAKNSSPPPPAAASLPASMTQPGVEPVAVETVARGRQASMNGGKRRPSPMGERLLMGHFNAH